jgi:hypothetical protein
MKIRWKFFTSAAIRKSSMFCLHLICFCFPAAFRHDIQSLQIVINYLKSLDENDQDTSPDAVHTSSPTNSGETGNVTNDSGFVVNASDFRSPKARAYLNATSKLGTSRQPSLTTCDEVILISL